MFQQDRFYMRMMREKAKQFRGAVASETDNSSVVGDWLFIHGHE